MKKMYLLLFTALLFSLLSVAQQQAYKASIAEDGSVTTAMFIPDQEYSPQKSLDQLPGFPKKMGASPNFKNMRGVTVADINQDGSDEILVASFNKLNVYTGDGSLLWQKNLSGTAIYPPAVADMDGNGTIGIVCVTGGVPDNGHIYYLDAQGDDQPGWPLNFNNHWVICGPVIADMDGDEQCEIIVQTRTSNNLHVLKQDGTAFGLNWPQNLAGTPAVTPSVADVNNDGVMDIVTAISNGTMYAFDAVGNALTGFPVASDGYSFSYQSPILADFEGDGFLSIVGATHGDAPKFYARNHDGNYRAGWPVAVPENYWTYSPPTVVDLTGNQEYSIFMSRPTGEEVAPMLYGFNPDGSLMDNFPITKSGGLEGFSSVADIDGDGQHELLFGSNLKIDGMGFIHAYKMDGTGELDGFPLRPTGFTFMNGANLGDIDGDGMLDLIALSYELNFSPDDSVFVNAYSLGISVEQANVLAGTYKGSNDHKGFVGAIAGNPTIVISPEAIIQDWESPGIVCQDLNISNIGNEVLDFTLSIEYLREEWLSVSVNSGAVNPGENMMIEVCMDATELNPGLYEAAIIIQSNDPEHPEVNVPVTLTIITGTNEMKETSFKTYPNPASDWIQLEFSDDTKLIRVVSQQGQILREFAVEELTQERLDLESFAEGVYQIQLVSNSGSVQNKMIIIRK